VSVESDLANVLRNLNAVVIEMSDNGRAAAEEIAVILETYAKAHHLWHPETGQTDLTTEAIVEEIGGVIEVALTAGTPHAVFLELAHQGRFSWLWPAMDANRQIIVEILRRHLGRTRREPL
jgi:hypothetical protein